MQDIKDAMDAISIIEDYSHFSNCGADMRILLGKTSLLLYLDKLYRQKQCKIEHGRDGGAILHISWSNQFDTSKIP